MVLAVASSFKGKDNWYLKPAVLKYRAASSQICSQNVIRFFGVLRDAAGREKEDSEAFECIIFS